MGIFYIIHGKAVNEYFAVSKSLEPELKERVIQRTFFGEVIDITEDAEEFIMEKENRKKKKKK